MEATSTSHRFPSQIKYIIGNEACERFSYYGMRSILTIYMIQYLMLAEPQAKGIFHYFIGAAYFFPLLGALISDRFWGKYRTIIIFSLIYCLGHAVLALFEGKVSGLYLGLALIAVGTGAIKACVSAHVGDQFTEKNSHLLDKVYEWFYFSVNFGAATSSLCIPWLLEKFGAAVAFGIPGILMGLATLIFWMGRKQFIVVPPTREASFLPIIWEAFKKNNQRGHGQKFLDSAVAKYGKERVEGVRAVFDVSKVFLLIIIFWALFDQQGSSWIIQAEKMDRVVLGKEILSSQVQALNPIFILIFIPLFSYGLYPLIEKIFKIKFTALKKMVAGMLITASSFACMTLYEVWIQNGQTPSILWHFLPFIFLTAGEILISIPGLEFAYTQAPRAMKSTIMSIWLLTISLGNFLTGFISQMNTFQGVNYFLFFTLLMAAAGIIFIWVAKNYKERNYIESSKNYPSNPSLDDSLEKKSESPLTKPALATE